MDNLETFIFSFSYLISKSDIVNSYVPEILKLRNLKGRKLGCHLFHRFEALKFTDGVSLPSSIIFVQIISIFFDWNMLLSYLSEKRKNVWNLNASTFLQTFRNLTPYFKSPERIFTPLSSNGVHFLYFYSFFSSAIKKFCLVTFDNFTPFLLLSFYLSFHNYDYSWLAFLKAFQDKFFLSPFGSL